MALTKAHSRMIENAPVNVKDFGATGDGSTDDTSAIQAAVTAAANKSLYIPAGEYLITSNITVSSPMKIDGDGYSSWLKGNGASGTLSITASNVSVHNIRFQSSAAASAGAIRIEGTNNADILVENCFFNLCSPVIHLFTCNNIMVQNCTFDRTGYGVLQAVGEVSSNVIVDSCIAKNMNTDFIEANCTNTAPSEFWTITNCIYTGHESYPTPETEGRFVGITSVKHVNISNNLVKNVAGDAAIHLEDSLGETIITGNQFDNIVTSGGNEGYIYLLNNAEDVIITSNVFQRTNAALGQAYAVDISSSVYTHSVTFSNNRVIGESISGNLDGFKMFGGTGRKIITNNIFESVGTCMTFARGPDNMVFSGNQIYSANEGIDCTACPSSTGGGLATGGGGDNILIQGNVFTSITNNDLVLGVNTNGTTPLDDVTIIDNIFDSAVIINGNASNQNADVTIANNVFRGSATLTSDSNGLRQMVYDNTFAGQRVSEVVGPYADDTAAASASVPVGGIYRNGSILQIRVS